MLPIALPMDDTFGLLYSTGGFLAIIILGDGSFLSSEIYRMFLEEEEELKETLLLMALGMTGD